jgi:DNA-binding IclR family transcriptional regulator
VSTQWSGPLHAGFAILNTRLAPVNPARLDRALTVLGYLAHHHEGRSLSNLATDLDLPMSSTHDLMQALVEIGAVRLAGPRAYAIGPRVVSLGLSIAESLDLRKVARPHLRALSEELNEHVYLAVRTGDDVVYADRYEASQLLSVVLQLGGGRPLHGSAVGKLLTAFDPDLETKVLGAARLEQLTPFTLVNRDRLRAEYTAIRRRGYSVSDGESVEGIIGLGTPILDAEGAAVGAVHISAPRGRLAADRLPVVITQLSRTAGIVSRQLGAPAASVPELTIDDVATHEGSRRHTA